MDHDSVAGAHEFISAGQIMGIATTVGCEIRASLDNTIFKNKRLNNPDENNIIYMAFHGIPHQNLEKVEDFLKPIRATRKVRMEKETQKLNDYLSRLNIDISLSFEKDVMPLTKYHSGGTVTERHILLSLSNKFIKNFGKGKSLISILERLDIDIPNNLLPLLSSLLSLVFLIPVHHQFLLHPFKKKRLLILLLVFNHLHHHLMKQKKRKKKNIWESI